MEQILGDRLLAERASVDQKQFIQFFEVVDLQPQSPASQAHIKEEHLEVAVIRLGAKRQSIPMATPHFMKHPRQAQQMQGLAKIFRSLGGVHLAEFELPPQHRRHAGEQTIHPRLLHPPRVFLKIILKLCVYMLALF